MATIRSTTDVDASMLHTRWRTAFLTTLLVTGIGLVIAVQQFCLKFLWDQSAHTRTVGGVLYMTLGVVGVGLPLLLCRYKRSFLSLTRFQQGVAAIAIPSVYLLAFAFCMETSMRSTTLVFARPFIPRAVVHFNPNGSHVEFEGGLRKDIESGYSPANKRAGVHEFSAFLYQGFLRHPRQQTVKIVGREDELNDGTVQITLDIDADEAIRLSAENLEDVRITKHGEPIGTSESQSGEFRIIITGQPQAGA
jgi:hypothetical protein